MLEYLLLGLLSDSKIATYFSNFDNPMVAYPAFMSYP